MLFNRDISISHKKLNDANRQLLKPPQKQKLTLKSGKLRKTSISSEWRHNHVVCYSKNKVLKNIVLRFLGRLSEILAAEFQKPVTVGIALYNFEMRTCWWCVMQMSPSAFGIMTPLRYGWRNGFVITIKKKLCFSKNLKNEKISTNHPLVDNNSKNREGGWMSISRKIGAWSPITGM